MATKKKPRSITFNFTPDAKGQKRFSALVEILTGKPFDPNPDPNAGIPETGKDATGCDV